MIHESITKLIKEEELIVFALERGLCPYCGQTLNTKHKFYAFLICHKCERQWMCTYVSV